MVRRRRSKPRILVVTPEIATLPPGMSRNKGAVRAKAGGMADVTASIVTSLFELGADVHVALPNYRKVFKVDIDTLAGRSLREYRTKLPGRRIHFAEDSVFYSRPSVYTGDVSKMALRFQREVINHILSDVEPDLIHCNDWMTGLIPAMARRLGIPSLFSIHNIHTDEVTLDQIEESGIAPQDFWRSLFYRDMPADYESTRDANRVDLLVSGIFAAHFINTVSPTFLTEIVEGRHPFVSDTVRREVQAKVDAGCAAGILNAPPSHYDPRSDVSLAKTYDAETLGVGKAVNKEAFQTELDLPVRPDAPLFFWPSRLDPVQKGCELLATILPEIVATYATDGIQVAIIADGADAQKIQSVISSGRLQHNVVYHPFDERLSRLGFAASDFTLMPSRFEPCGLPQMIGAIYGSLPIAHDTGGLHDTVTHLDINQQTGNGFVFRHYDADGFRWAVDEAMRFYRHGPDTRHTTAARVMHEATVQFAHDSSARQYFALYERILDRPLVV